MVAQNYGPSATEKLPGELGVLAAGVATSSTSPALISTFNPVVEPVFGPLAIVHVASVALVLSRNVNTTAAPGAFST